ncbi:MAG: prepilin peptidase [Planctomycetaceae bacterium]|nr:prepilin peptidase [Planctomycetaceae bacterium]
MPLTLHLLYAATLFVLGTVVGSFLNVVIYRLPLGLSLLRPPSHCPGCGKPVRTRDNVPILGWLILRGRCRDCRTRIAARYPAVELGNGLLWAAVGWNLADMTAGTGANIGMGLLGVAFVSAMLVVFFIDLDHFIIPDVISLGGLVLALAAAPLLPVLHHAATAIDFAEWHMVLDAVLGPAPAWLRSLSVSAVGAAIGLGFSLVVYYLGTAAFRRQIEAARRDDPEVDSALGLGDVKLMTLLGAFLGGFAVVFIFLAGSVLGVVVGSWMKVRSGQGNGKTGMAGLRERWRNGSSVIPFGPFLTVAAVIFYFFQEPLLRFFGMAIPLSTAG